MNEFIISEIIYDLKRLAYETSEQDNFEIVVSIEDITKVFEKWSKIEG